MENSTTPKKKRRGGPRRKTGWSDSLTCTLLSTVNKGASCTCKSRHSRCDEKKPVCSNCKRLNLECRQTEFIAPSEWNNTFENTLQTRPSAHASPSFSSEGPASTWDIFKSHIQGLDIISDESPPTDALRYINLSTPTPTVSTASTVSSVTLTPESAFLLQTYLRTLATWMDLMDHSNTYQLSITRLSLTSPLLFHCICAFAANYLAYSNCHHNSSWDPVARNHYGESLRLLISALNSPFHEHALTATILMSSYEIMSSVGLEHRRHFLGAMMLIKSHGITAQSQGIDRANFWVYVRHEIGVALATEQPLILKPEEWNVQWEERETREDVLGNHVLWILARVINLVYGKESNTETERQQRGEFLRELEEWRAGLSDTFIGIPYGDEDEEGFRKVYFTVTAAAAAAFWYHIIHILLYAEPTIQDECYKPKIQDQAMRITNIAISEFPDSLRVFSTHGLYYAAKHINGIARKARIWNILNDVETQLGYHTRSIVRRLQALVEHDD